MQGITFGKENLPQELRKVSGQVTAEGYDAFVRAFKESGYKSHGDYLMSLVQREDQEIQEMKGNQISEKEYFQYAQKHMDMPRDEPDEMDKMMKTINKMMSLQMMQKMMESLSGGNSGNAGTSEIERRQEHRDRIEYERLQTARRESMDDRIMMMNMMGGGNKGGGDVQLLIQQMQQQQAESDRKFQEYLRTMEDSRRQEKIEEKMSQIEVDREFYKDQLSAERETKAQELMDLKAELEEKMRIQMKEMSLGGAKEQQDEFTQTLATYSKVNSLIESIAPNLGFKKPAPLAGGVSQMAKAITAPAPTRTETLVNSLGAATGLVSEVRALINDGTIMANAAKGGVPVVAMPRPAGMPTVPRAPMPNQTPGPTPLTNTEQKTIPMTPTKPMVKVQDGDRQWDIDQDIMDLVKSGEFKLDGGGPIPLHTLAGLTELRRSNAGTAEMDICSEHGELLPCPYCDTKPPTATAAPELTKSQPGSCPVCGSPGFTQEAGCQPCQKNLQDVVGKYQPLVDELTAHNYPLDKLDAITKKVDDCWENAAKFQYDLSAKDLEDAGQLVVAGLEETIQSKAPPQGATADEIDQMDALISGQGSSINQITEGNPELDFTDAINKYNLAIGKFNVGEYAEAMQFSGDAVTMAQDIVKTLTPAPAGSWPCAECGKPISEGTICAGCALSAMKAKPAPLTPPIIEPIPETAPEPEPEPEPEPVEAIPEPLEEPPAEPLPEVANDQDVIEVINALVPDIPAEEIPPLPEPEPEPEPEDKLPALNPGFELAPGVAVPDGRGPIVWLKTLGEYGRVIDQSDDGEAVVVQTNGVTESTTKSDISKTVCQFCGKDCATSGGRATHERFCSKKYFLEG